MEATRSVALRAEHDGEDSRYLTAYLDARGDLHIYGQDLGPKTAPVSNDGEYEWDKTVTREHIPDLLALLGAPADADILDELAAHWTATASYHFERKLRDSDIPVRFWSWP